jgi:sorbitol-specific phosphotransferase system component IIBC
METAMDAMTKMWVSLFGIGMMAIAALLITFARLKTKGVVKFVLSLIAFIILIIGFICGLISII